MDRAGLAPNSSRNIFGDGDEIKHRQTQSAGRGLALAVAFVLGDLTDLGDDSRSDAVDVGKFAAINEGASVPSNIGNCHSGESAPSKHPDRGLPGSANQVGEEIKDHENEVEKQKPVLAKPPQEYEKCQQKSAAERDTSAHAEHKCERYEDFEHCSHEVRDTDRGLLQQPAASSRAWLPSRKSRTLTRQTSHFSSRSRP